MRKLYCIFFILTLSLSVFSQTTFEKKYDNGSLDLGASVKTLDDGYLMCGATFDDVNLDFDVFATKVDLEGNVVWTNIYTSAGVGHDYATYMCETSDGGFVITGTSFDPSVGDQDAFVMKINNLGIESWIKEFDGGAAENDFSNYIFEGIDNNLYFCGSSTKSDLSTDIWVVKLDSNGNELRENFYGLNGNDEAYCAIEYADGSLAIVGKSYDAVNADNDGVLIRTDVAGIEIWKVFSTGTADELYNDFVIDANGNFIIVGAMEDEVNKDYDLLLTSVSSNGSLLNYQYTFDHQAGNDFANRIYIYQSNCIVSGYIQDMTNNDIDAYLCLVNPTTGTILGDVTYGGIYEDEFLDFDFTNDNGFICIGYSQNLAAGNSDVYLVKTDANGEQTLINENIVNNEATIYPNPSSEIINIVNNNYSTYSIISLDGKVIENGSINDNSVNISNLKSGIYFITLKNNSKTSTLKFIKE